MNYETLKKTFLGLQADLSKDYPDVNGNAICQMMHQDIDLDRTPRPDAEELADKWEEEHGEEVDPESLDLTVEHAQLHAFFQALIMQSMMTGVSGSQLLALLFVIGRRWGLKEADGTIEHVESESPAEAVESLEAWLHSQTGDIDDSPHQANDSGEPTDER